MYETEYRRRMIAGLRTMGCNCTPAIIFDPATADGDDVTGLISHDLDCPALEWLDAEPVPGCSPVVVFEADR